MSRQASAVMDALSGPAYLTCARCLGDRLKVVKIDRRRNTNWNTPGFPMVDSFIVTIECCHCGASYEVRS